MSEELERAMKVLKERLRAEKAEERARRRKLSQEFSEDYSDPEHDDSWGGIERTRTADLSENMTLRDMRKQMWKATREDYRSKRTMLLTLMTAVSVLSTLGLSIYGDEPAVYEKLGYSKETADKLWWDVPLLGIMGTLIVLIIMTLNSFRRDERELYESIDILLEMREQFPNIPADIDAEKLKRLISMLPVILKNLSDSDKQVLDGLMKGDANVLNDEERRDMAAKIMTKHLKSHPKDLEMLINAYRGIIDFNYAQQMYGPKTSGMKRY